MYVFVLYCPEFFVIVKVAEVLADGMASNLLEAVCSNDVAFRFSVKSVCV